MLSPGILGACLLDHLAIYSRPGARAERGHAGTEIRNSTWAQVDFEKRFLTVSRSKTRAGEGQNHSLNSVLLAALLDHARWYTRRFGMTKPSGFLFPFGKSKHLDPTRPMTTLKTAWTNIKTKAGIAGPLARCTPHATRW